MKQQENPIYTNFHNCSHSQKRKSLEELKTLAISTRLLYNAAFVSLHLVERFSKNFSEVLEVKGLRFSCAQNYEKKCKVVFAMYLIVK